MIRNDSEVVDTSKYTKKVRSEQSNHIEPPQPPYAHQPPPGAPGDSAQMNHLGTSLKICDGWKMMEKNQSKSNSVLRSLFGFNALAFLSLPVNLVLGIIVYKKKHFESYHVFQLKTKHRARLISPIQKDQHCLVTFRNCQCVGKLT